MIQYVQYIISHIYSSVCSYINIYNYIIYIYINPQEYNPIVQSQVFIGPITIFDGKSLGILLW